MRNPFALTKAARGPAAAWLVMALTVAAPNASSPASAEDGPLPADFDRIETIVVVYAENRSFAHLLPDFAGIGDAADAPPSARLQRDRDGTVLPRLPAVWDAKRNKSGHAVADPAYPSSMPNAPFPIDTAPVDLPKDVLTVSPVHRFYQNKMQINGGRNDMFVAWSDTGALTMGHYSSSGSHLAALARDYTLADRFFMAAHGGSNLNHFFLACACAPPFPDAPEAMRAVLDSDGRLALASDSPASALDGPPRFVRDGAVSPDGHVVNTVQPAHQPSGIAPAPGGDPRLADPAGHPLPPLTLPTIGERLSAKGIAWAWYAQGWDLAGRDRSVIYNRFGPVDFQPHHQPYNYFAAFAPGTAAREQHLKDLAEFWRDAEAGTLPAVVFVKPDGRNNQHPGESTVAAGDLMIGTLVDTLKRSPQWPQMAIIVTYDENGGFWDPVAPPAGDRWGPGNRVPAVIVSPFAKKGFVDHTVYDTTSILAFIAKRFDIALLPGVRTEFGDLRNAFAFGE